jgi:hypothetical protein
MQIHNKWSYMRNVVTTSNGCTQIQYVRTHLCPLEVQNQRILKEFHPGTRCCQECFQPASGAILETWGLFGLEHQDLVIQTIRLSNTKTELWLAHIYRIGYCDVYIMLKYHYYPKNFLIIQKICTWHHTEYRFSSVLIMSPGRAMCANAYPIKWWTVATM